jgi:hypothetical protein
MIWFKIFLPVMWQTRPRAGQDATVRHFEVTLFGLW